MFGRMDGSFDIVITEKKFDVRPRFLFPGDFNNDGVDEIIFERGLIFFDEQGKIIAEKSFCDDTHRAALAADFNNDGLDDLIIAEPQNESSPNNIGMSVLSGKGDGTFAEPVTCDIETYPLFTGPYYARDIDYDGNLDVVFLYMEWLGKPVAGKPVTYPMAISHFLYIPGNGDGSFSAALELDAALSVSPALLPPADINNDGFDDWVAVYYPPYSMCRVLLNDGLGGLHVSFERDDLATQTNMMHLMDENNDGNPDLCITEREYDENEQMFYSMTVYPGKGDGTFAENGFSGVVFPYVEHYSRTPFPVGDFNHDGAQDFYAVTDTTTQLNVYLHDGITSVDEDADEAGVITYVSCTPNPFNAATDITIDMGFDSDITVAVYNILGQKIRTLHDGAVRQGRFRVRWDGRDMQGLHVASGTYLCTVRVGNGAGKSIKLMYAK